MKLPLSPKEIMSEASSIGFKNRRYILDYPELFEENVELLLKSEFGEPFFPFFNLLTNYKSEHRLVFANTSLTTDIRSPPLPSIISNEAYRAGIHKILEAAHEAVKKNLAEQRKIGLKPIPKSEKDRKERPIENYGAPNCPYCNFELEKFPKEKKKCPRCGNFIFVRTSPISKKKILIREDQISEIENQQEEVWQQNNLNRLIGRFKADSERFEEAKTKLQKQFGTEPSDRDVVWHLIIQEGLHHASNYNMGFYRNSILLQGDFLKFEGRSKNALVTYLDSVI